MAEKQCTKCGEVKPVSEFCRDTRLVSKLRSDCRSCNSKGSAKRKQRARQSHAQWSWFNRNVERWRYGASKRSDISLEDYVLYVEARPLGWCAATNWPKPQRTQSPIATMSAADAYRYRYHNDPEFNAWERIRNQFTKWRSGGRASSLIRTLGYTRQDLASHLEAQFSDGMSWANYGEWHIDHIIPKNLFDPTSKRQLRECWSLDNLRPLWAKDNCSRPRDGSDLFVTYQ